VEVLPGGELLERSEQAASGFKGVTRTGERWRAYYSKPDLPRKHIGFYDTALDAARARRAFLMKSIPRVEGSQNEGDAQGVETASGEELTGDELLERSDRGSSGFLGVATGKPWRA